MPLVRDDVGGVLVGAGSTSARSTAPSTSTSTGCCAAPPSGCEVRTGPGEGPGRHRQPAAVRSASAAGRTTTLGRAVQIGTVPTTVVRDGVPYPRPMDRWTFYKHTEPLRLVGGTG